MLISCLGGKAIIMLTLVNMEDPTGLEPVLKVVDSFTSKLNNGSKCNANTVYG